MEYEICVRTISGTCEIGTQAQLLDLHELAESLGWRPAIQIFGVGKFDVRLSWEADELPRELFLAIIGYVTTFDAYKVEYECNPAVQGVRDTAAQKLAKLKKKFPEAFA